MAAAWQGDVAAVRALIETGADVNQIDLDDASALMNAIVSEVASDAAKLEIVKLLVKAGCDVNYRDPEDDSAMALAATEGVPQIVEYLLQHGASANITVFYTDSTLGIAEQELLRHLDCADFGLHPENAPMHRGKADAIARSIKSLEEHGARSFEDLQAEKVGKWVRITPHCKTGLLTDTGHLTIEQLPGATKSLGEQFRRWFDEAVATRVAADRALTPPGFDWAAHNALGWQLAQTIKKLVLPAVKVEVMIVDESTEGNRSGGYRTACNASEGQDRERAAS